MNIQKNNLEARLKELAGILVNDLNPAGFWDGRLSSSALGAAVSVAALFFDNPEDNIKETDRGLQWLRDTVNSDGSYGDTPESPGNISTSLLVYAALNLFSEKRDWVKPLQNKVANYLRSNDVDVESPQVSQAILDHYKNDYTFSVPILAMCGVCGVPGDEAFNHIPQLPFELSLLPRSLYRLLNLSVVSYAIPALISVGILIYRKKRGNLFSGFLRRYSTDKAIKLLHNMLPESGGYLEAVPLTAFVVLSLVNAGYRDTEIVKRGIGFIKSTQREDGGWPIDVDLSTWVSSLSVKAFGTRLDEFLDENVQYKIYNHFKLIQNREVHPFNGTSPGGWGWTHYSGSVPDGDDTPGAILAMLKLQPAEMVKSDVLAACKWLSKLQNSDGGFPTFSKGWGRLPFDRSCSDLTGHCLLAISSVIGAYRKELNSAEHKMLINIFNKSLRYLEKNQSHEGSWLPLWFGNQHTEGFVNPVYGTARVTTYIKDILANNWLENEIRERLSVMVERGTRFLLSVRNEDGSWGGGKNITGTIEETALAISALSSVRNRNECLQGLQWIDEFYSKNGLKSSPIGLYFALLWYDEKMYPLTAYIEALVRVLDMES